MVRVWEVRISPTSLAFGVLTFSKGIRWCAAGGRFPRRRRPVPPAPATRFPQNSILATQKHFGACFFGHKKPLREWGHALPRFSLQVCVFCYFFENKKDARRPYDHFPLSFAPRSLLCVRKRRFPFLKPRCFCAAKMLFWGNRLPEPGEPAAGVGGTGRSSETNRFL